MSKTWNAVLRPILIIEDRVYNVKMAKYFVGRRHSVRIYKIIIKTLAVHCFPAKLGYSYSRMNDSRLRRSVLAAGRIIGKGLFKDE